MGMPKKEYDKVVNRLAQKESEAGVLLYRVKEIEGEHERI
jgi:hypothetical protein